MVVMNNVTVIAFLFVRTLHTFYKTLLLDFTYRFYNALVIKRNRERNVKSIEMFRRGWNTKKGEESL